MRGLEHFTFDSNRYSKGRIISRGCRISNDSKRSLYFFAVPGQLPPRKIGPGWDYG